MRDLQHQNEQQAAELKANEKQLKEWMVRAREAEEAASTEKRFGCCMEQRTVMTYRLSWQPIRFDATVAFRL